MAKDQKITIRVSAREKEMIARGAQGNDMKMSEFLRECALHQMRRKEPNTVTDLRTKWELDDSLGAIPEQFVNTR